jgi:hypothetical protein
MSFQCTTMRHDGTAFVDVIIFDYLALPQFCFIQFGKAVFIAAIHHDVQEWKPWHPYCIGVTSLHYHDIRLLI